VRSSGSTTTLGQFVTHGGNQMRLKDWLRANEMRGSEFAELVGITPSAVCQLQQGRVWPTRWTAKKIFELTDGTVTPNDFLDVCEKEIPQEPSAQRILIKDIATKIANRYGMTFSTIVESNHSHEVAKVRYEIFHSCVIEHAKSITETGRALNRNHATVRYGIARHAGMTPAECRKCKGRYPSAFLRAA
jgi:transcriptional regulator with XRE-family HTH domain